MLRLVLVGILSASTARSELTLGNTEMSACTDEQYFNSAVLQCLDCNENSSSSEADRSRCQCNNGAIY